MSYKAVKLNLSEKQIWQAVKGKPIRVSPAQINHGNEFVYLHPENVKKVERAYLKKTGLLLNLSHGELLETASAMNGSGFWGNVWNAVKKGWNALKNSGVLTAAADAAVAPLASLTGQPALVSGARKLLKDTTGVGVCGTKKLTKTDRMNKLKGSGLYLS